MNEDMKTLQKWKDGLETNLSAYSPELGRMTERENQYNGTHALRPITEQDKGPEGCPNETPHLWNITQENIESEIDGSIPSGKVSPTREEDRPLADMIEAMIRDENDRQSTEEINDLAERICKVQGGVFYLVEWDMGKRAHRTMGENAVTVLHPRRLIPQAGVDRIEDMDSLYTRVPMTKGAVRRRWGVDVSGEQEADPTLRGDGGNAPDMVTVETAYHRDDEGHIGKTTWVNDTLLEDLEDYQARRLRRCKKCGQTETDAWTMRQPTQDGTYPGGGQRRPRRDECPYCHSRSWEDISEDGRWMTLEELQAKGVREEVLLRMEAEGMPEEEELLPEEGVYGAQSSLARYWVPYYKPGLYPVVLQRNISAFGKFLGESDCDRIKDQQNSLNRIELKILERTIKCGQRIGLPADTVLTVDPRDNEVWYMQDSKLAQVKKWDFMGDLSQILQLRELIYEESRRVLGITDSFQGRADTTATSGKAKEFAAAQAAGRMESRRILKKAAWADIYEREFKNRLAYCDEKRPMRDHDEKGNETYKVWNSWAFLDIDEAGELYWNDEFRFSCDNASGLAANREAMWQEITAQFRSGAYGNPAEIKSLITYWTMMEQQAYPGAGTIKALLQERQEELAAQAAQLQGIQPGAAEMM